MLLISLKGINTTNTNEASSSVAHDGRGEAQQSFVGYTSTPVHQSSHAPNFNNSKRASFKTIQLLCIRETADLAPQLHFSALMFAYL